MANQLVACARELFEGVPGSAAQKQANAWLMALQRSDDAWEPALQVLQQPPRERGCVLAAPVLVAMQIVRLKTSQEWMRMSAQQKLYVRDVRAHCGCCCCFVLPPSCSDRKGSPCIGLTSFECALDT